MGYETEQIARRLKSARESKGLSQRALGEKAGVPQAHISKIENGAVDLRLSSLVALTRCLDLELTLVPRKAISAVQSVVRTGEPAAGSHMSRATLKGLESFQRIVASVADQLKPSKELAQLQRQFRELQHFQLAKSQIESLKEIGKALQGVRNNSKGLNELRQAVSRIQDLRNELAHASANLREPQTVRPAYTLDEESGDA